MNDELRTLLAGSAIRPGTPTALWLGSVGHQHRPARVRERSEGAYRLRLRRLVRLAGQLLRRATVNRPASWPPGCPDS